MSKIRNTTVGTGKWWNRKTTVKQYLLAASKLDIKGIVNISFFTTPNFDP